MLRILENLKERYRTPPRSLSATDGDPFGRAASMAGFGPVAPDLRLLRALADVLGVTAEVDALRPVPGDVLSLEETRAAPMLSG